MGSVLDLVECPNCGQEANSDYNYKTGEEVVLCQYCGYYKSVTIKKNCDKRFNELEDEDWDIIEIKKPYAAYRIKYKDSYATEVGTLISHEDFLLLKKAIQDEDNGVEVFSISRLKNGEIEETKIIDNEQV